MSLAETNRPVQQARAASRQQRTVRRKLGRAAVMSILSSRRFHEAAIVAVVALLAVIGLAREGQSSAFERLAAWDKARSLAGQRKSKPRTA